MKHTGKALLAAACLLTPAHRTMAAPGVPASFTVSTVGSGFDTPTAMAFLPGGRMLVAEKRGRVYTLKNGVKSSLPLWTREGEVLNEGDRGLLGLAVDPNYVSNRRIYLLFTVDPDSNNIDNDNDAFSRLVRYEVSSTDSTTVDYSTRTVLLGVTWRQGILSASSSHSIGSLRFGTDGSLMVSAGDGAWFTTTDAGGLDPAAFGAGQDRTDPYEDIGAFRAQSLTSLCGKVLRINPANGDGYPSNPYWNGDARSIRSRIWAYGFRNPFRFCIRPGSGSSVPTDGDPGTAYIGDVGLGSYEETNVVRTPGMNFGWPCYEGSPGNSSYQSANPAHNGCNSFGQADNPASHTIPSSYWHHGTGSLSSPAGLIGNSSIGGVFYTSASYPAQYQGAYFFADYGRNWMRVANFNASDQLVSMQSFGDDMDGPVDFAVDPASGDIFYVSISTSEVRRIRYTGGVPNPMPIPVANGTPTGGSAPLSVSFSSAGSFDPDGDPIGFFWSFGDGLTSTQVNPVKTYSYPGTYIAVLTVTDDLGGLARDTVVISVVGTSGFPTTSVLDDFNRANGEIGASWTGQAGAYSINTQTLAAAAGGSIVWNDVPYGANQEAYFTISTLGATTPEHDLMLKVQGTTWDTGHLEVWYDHVNQRINVVTYDPQQGWIDHGFIAPITLVAGDRLGARALADGSVQVYRNGTGLGTVSVTTWPFATVGGRIGLSTIGAQSSRLDNFGGGNVVFATNSAPIASILEPLAGGFYFEGDSIRLRGDGSDAEQTASQLAYHWRVDVHHNNHVHPSVYVSDLRNDVIAGENHDDGTGVFYRMHLEVTDGGGLKDTDSVSVYPEVNLAPHSLVTAPGSPSAGAPMEIRFAIQNLGRMPAPEAGWLVRDGGSVIAAGDTLVPALSEVTVTAVVPAPVAGPYALRAVVDTAALVPETIETDNAAVHALVIAGVPLDVEVAPRVLALGPARPNPTASAAEFAFELPAAASVQFEVFDLQGRNVWRAPTRRYAAGRWDLSWPGIAGDGGRVHAGVYLAVVRVAGRTFIRRIARL